MRRINEGRYKIMNQNGKRRATSADKMINVVIVIVVAAFIVLGVFAVKDKISLKPNNEETAPEQTETTVAQLADTAGMSVEDYLAQYNLTLSDTLTPDTTETEMLDMMSIENYLKYNAEQNPDAQQQTADEIINQYKLQDKVTKDTPSGEFFDILYSTPISSFMSEDEIAQVKQQFGLTDEEITGDTLYSDYSNVIYQKQIEAAQAAQAAQASAAPEADAQTDAQADTQTDGAETSNAEESAAE